MSSNTPSASAVYASPNSSQSFQHPVAPSPAPDNVHAKTAYLAQLGQSTRKLQDDINAFLTERMDEDKKSAEVSEREAREEENYGEENVEGS